MTASDIGGELIPEKAWDMCGSISDDPDGPTAMTHCARSEPQFRAESLWVPQMKRKH